MYDDVELARTVECNIDVLRHRGHLVILNSSGQMIVERGSSMAPVFARSVLKPFRAVALRQLGIHERFPLPDEASAVFSGSHSGSSIHCMIVSRILSLAGLGVDDLQCSVRCPIGVDAIEELGTGQLRISKLTCDCSGEHAGALLGSIVCSGSVDDYLSANSQLQRIYFETIRKYFPPPMAQCIDLCNMPTYAWPLRTITDAWRLFNQDRQKVPSINSTLSAIEGYPIIYGGNGRIVTNILVRSEGTILGKDGAAGLYVFHDRRSALTIGVKMSDGSTTPSVLAIRETLEQIGDPNFDDWDPTPQRSFGKILPRYATNFQP